MSTSFTPKPLIAALIAAGLTGLAQPRLAATVQEEVTLTGAHQITPAEEAVISSAAVKVLRHIAEARGELQADSPDTAAAKTELDQAEKLLDIIQASLPTAQVKDRIWVAKKHLEYEDSREVLPDLVPIYGALNELIDYLPTATAKAHLDEAKQALEADQKDQAQAQLAEVDDALLYVEADLPLGATRHLVAQAKADLTKGDVQAANQASAEDNVVFISVCFDSPLVEARSALWRAREEFGAGDNAMAASELQAAVTALEAGAKSPDQREREDAGNLVGEVREMHGLLDHDGAGFRVKLEYAGQRLQALSERAAEYVSTGWERLRAKNPAKRDLIEAKLNVAYARIDHAVIQDDAAARIDLTEARGYLDAAEKALAPDAKAKLDELRRQVDDLEQALDKGDVKSGQVTAFNAVEADLAGLIRKL